MPEIGNAMNKCQHSYVQNRISGVWGFCPSGKKVYFQFMSKWPFAFLVFLSSISCVFFLPGCCNSDTQKSGKVSFKDEKSMQETLKGSWILKEYQDSIDAGLTPKLLEHMLEGENSINYFDLVEGTSNRNMNLENLHIYGKTQIDMIGYGSNFGYYYTKTVFDYKSNELFFFTRDHNPYGEKLTKRLIGKGKFIISETDTLLSFEKDSISKPKIFIKYSSTSCEQGHPYEHLVNSKFIAGKYFLDSDTERSHHIIFTKCGNVERAENIDHFLTEHNSYKVILGGYISGSDRLNFVTKGSYSEYFWSLHQDSLILGKKIYSHYELSQDDFTLERIVLVKAR